MQRKLIGINDDEGKQEVMTGIWNFYNELYSVDNPNYRPMS